MNSRTALPISDPAPDDRKRLLQLAVRLAIFTVGYNLLEGAVSIGFGVADESLALAGFGVDSLIEVGSALLVLWRFEAELRGRPGLPLARERRATLAIGVLYLLLAAATLAGAALQWRAGAHPATTLPGVVISSISLAFMYFLWRAKTRLAHRLDSAVLRADAGCSLYCIYLSLVLLSGSALFALAPALWWADAAAAGLLALLVAREGFSLIRAARHPDFTGGCNCAGESAHA